MKRRRSYSLSVGRGTIRETVHGTFMAYLRASGRSLRRCFSDIESARRWIEQTSASDEALPGLTKTQYFDAQKAFSILPAGVSLVDVVRDYERARRSRADSSVLLSAATEQFLEDRRVSVTARSLYSYRNELASLLRFLGDRELAEISTDDLEPFVKSKAGSTRNTRIARIGAMFSWAVRRGWIHDNPCTRLARARKVEAEIGVFTPDEAERVLHAAQNLAPECVPYLAVGMFAGIRPYELRRLTPACFTRAGLIKLDGKITKAARARIVEIRPNLAAWLEAYPWRRPPIRSKTIIPSVVCHAAGVAWKHDGMRHSFATYAYEQSRDAAAVAAEMGHRGTDVFFNHYRALAEPGDGARFFAILPAKVHTGA